MNKKPHIFIRIMFLSLLALLLNGEYYRYGIDIIFQPMLLFLYFTFVTSIFYLVTRYHWGIEKTFLLGSILGLFIETIFTRSIFFAPFFLGVNWLSVSIQMIYWGLLVSVVSVYFLKKLNQEESLKKYFFKTKGYMLVVAWIILMVIWALNIKIYFDYASFYMLIFIGFLTIILFSIKNQENNFNLLLGKRKLMDKAVGLYIIVELVLGTFFRAFYIAFFIISGFIFGIFFIFLYGKKNE